MFVLTVLPAVLDLILLNPVRSPSSGGGTISIYCMGLPSVADLASVGLSGSFPVLVRFKVMLLLIDFLLTPQTVTARDSGGDGHCASATGLCGSYHSPAKVPAAGRNRRVGRRRSRLAKLHRAHAAASYCFWYAAVCCVGVLTDVMLQMKQVSCRLCRTR